MSDPLLIALLALVGSALGGFASPLIIKLLDRQFARNDESKNEAKHTKEAITGALQVLLREAYATDLARARNQGVSEAYQRLIAAVGAVELLLTPKDEEISDVIWDTFAEVFDTGADADKRVRVLGRLMRDLAAWQRGSTSAHAILTAMKERKALLSKDDTT